jgi:adenylate cyclase
MAAAAALVAMGLSTLGWLDEIELESFDRRLVATQGAVTPHPDVAVVEINESSLDALEPVFGRWPWPRITHAAVIDFLARGGARVIAYDVLLLEHDRRSAFPVGETTMSGAESDQALSESIGRAGNVILAASAAFEGLEAGEGPVPPAPALPGPAWDPGVGFQVRPHLQLPIEPFANVAAGVGHTTLALDGDGTVRRILPFVEAQGRVVPWLGLAAALHAQAVPSESVRLDGAWLNVADQRILLGDDEVPGTSGTSRQLPLWPRARVRSYSFFDVIRSEEQLRSGEAPTIDPAVFKDAVVFVGPTAASLNDVFASPLGGAAWPGVFVHATTADMALSKQWMTRASVGVDAAVTFAAGVGAAAAPMFLPVAGAMVVLVLGLLALVAVVTMPVQQGLWLAAAMPILAYALAAFGATTWQYVVEGRQKRQVKALFGRYVSPDVLSHLMAHPDVALGGQSRDMSVLFSDIRGYTTAVEHAAPEVVVAQLNEYFTAMVEVLFRHHGTLDKFVGDQVMGLFGAPMDDPDHADHAVAAAVDMVATLGRLNAHWSAQGLPVLDIGIGVSSGAMIAGNIGSAAVMSYTVIGDAVNLGARLESLNKTYGTRILISGDTHRRLTRSWTMRPLGDVTVKGKTASVPVYAVETT